MILGRVCGTVVATCKDPKLTGSKLLVVKEIDIAGKPTGTFFVAMDTVGAGYGETVILVRGSSARMTEFTNKSPVDTAIIAIIDIVEVHKQVVFKKEEEIWREFAEPSKS